MSVDINDLRSLPLVDKLRIVELLWDDIATSSEPFPIEDWQKAEIRRRAEELERRPEEALTRAELWQRVQDGNV